MTKIFVSLLLPAGRLIDDLDDLLAALHHSVTPARTLMLLIHSHAPFSTFLPRDNPWSGIAMGTIDLPGGQA